MEISMTVATTAPDDLGALFNTAYRSHSSIPSVPPQLEPVSLEDAYAAQENFLKLTGASIGGWKVGSKSDSGPINCAPLPLPGIHQNGALLKRNDYPVLGLELEITFCFSRDFKPRKSAISEQEVRQSIGAIGSSIELVSSRIAGWPKVPPLVQLADLQNHGALLIGERIAYRDDFPFQSLAAHLTINDKDIFNGIGTNPAGDPRRLLGWLVNHCSQRGIAIPAGTVITTGSYVGMHFPQESGMVRSQIAGLPPINFELV